MTKHRVSDKIARAVMHINAELMRGNVAAEALDRPTREMRRRAALILRCRCGRVLALVLYRDHRPIAWLAGVGPVGHIDQGGLEYLGDATCRQCDRVQRVGASVLLAATPPEGVAAVDRKA